MNNQTELGNAITTSIGIMSVENVAELVDLLQKSGSKVTTSSSQEELLEAAFIALKNSSSFREGLANYLSKEAISSDANYGNYVEDGFFNNFTNPFISSPVVGNFVGSKISNLANNSMKSDKQYSGFTSDNDFFNFVPYKPNVAGSGSAFGNALRGVFSKENIDTIVKSGISIAAAKLAANASKGSEQNAIAYEAQKAQTAANEELAANAKKAAAEAGATGATPKWVLPVGIGAGVLVLGTIVYFIVKK